MGFRVCNQPKRGYSQREVLYTFILISVLLSVYVLQRNTDAKKETLSNKGHYAYLVVLSQCTMTQEKDQGCLCYL